MDSEIIFALDIGTTKVCALVGEVRDGQLQIIGLGIEPSRGMKKGMVVDVSEARAAIEKAIEQAEQSSGYELDKAFISMAGAHLESENSNGKVAISRNGDGVTSEDIKRALDRAIEMSIPPNRTVVHSVPRAFEIDEHKEIVSPIGMFGNHLSVEAHIVTASHSALRNLERCTTDLGLRNEGFVLNTLASAEAVLEPTEREMGVIVADIGGGTCDIAIYSEGHVWHTDVIPIGGFHFTNDIAIGLRVPYDIAEQVKLQYGNCLPSDIDPENVFKVKPFSGEQIEVGLQDLAEVVEARAEELFDMVLESIRASGYEGLTPAGMVLTGGTAQLRNIAAVSERILGVPTRVARPRNLVGLVDKLASPKFSTSVGLLRWAMTGSHMYKPEKSNPGKELGSRLKSLWKVFAP